MIFCKNKLFNYEVETFLLLKIILLRKNSLKISNLHVYSYDMSLAKGRIKKITKLPSDQLIENKISHIIENDK